MVKFVGCVVVVVKGEVALKKCEVTVVLGQSDSNSQTEKQPWIWRKG
jgi:hypothetical protein